ncbi:unnamed protein product [Adineta ricciae]|uniref:C2 domain-containing protein n=1 Tax=Adineta ricciae TaxID=249248 RepID=A0A815LG57_ADIRI|nr:unnamed protein product [Adineta ricciae]
MTDLYHHEHQPKSTSTLPAHTSVLTESTMPSYYPQTRHRPFISRHLADHDDDDSDSTYKEAFIVQVFQHWKLKTLEHQQALHNPANITTHNGFAQISSTNPPVSPTETATSNNTPNDSSSSENKDETSNVSDPSKSIESSIQKRAIPLVTTQARRRTAFRKSLSTPPDCSNPNLLTPYTKTRSAPTASNSNCNGSNTSTATTRKPAKPAPIFIAPKKSQPRSYTWLSISTDDVSQTKRKSITGDEQNPAPISPLWAPAPPTIPTRFFTQSSGVLYDDDGTSSDENNHESLLIRNKRFFKKPSKTKENHVSFVPSNLIIPTTICITDPDGHSRVFDCSTDWMDGEFANSERIIENDYLAAATFNPNHTYDYCSSSSSTIPITSSSSPSPNSLDKYGLHSIGEEEEEEENRDGLILSKELNHIQAYSRVRQTNSSVEKKDSDQSLKHKLKLPLERRWSDSCVSDDEDPIELQPPRLIKMASATSITKQTPAKISKTKYLLMKLHLAPSPTKDDDTNMSTASNSTNVPTKSESLQIPTETSKQSANIKRQESSPVVASNKSTEPKPKSNLLSATYSAAAPIAVRGREDRLKSVENRDEPRTNRTASVGTRASAGDSDEDTDKNFRQGSQLSLNSGMSDSKANYELDITGTIEIRLSYNIKSGSLEILINKCTNLARAKRNQTSNPYCKCYLLPDQLKSSKLKTSIKKHTTDPVFAETLRYRVSSDEFSSRILWISVWSQSSIGHNDFLGEIHIPLAHCTLDKVEEHTLLSRMANDDATSNAGAVGDSNVLQFDLTFLENRQDKETGTIQINEIQGIGIYYGKHPVDAICKGVLMPDKLKRKLPTVRKGPNPKWDIPLRWENVRRKNLPSMSLEISIWCQERFRKPMIGSIQLRSTSTPSDSKVAKGSGTLKTEISAWETFLKDPTTVHHCRLPLRSNTQEK